MIAFVRVPVGAGGLPGCARCGEASRVRMRPAPDVLSDIDSSVAGWEAGPGPNVWLAGAEAFLHTELPSLVSGAVRAGVERVRISTGGAALAHGDNAAGSLAAGVRHVEVVLLGSDPGMHDALASRPGGFSEAETGIGAWEHAARSAGIDVSLTGRVPVCAHNVADVPSTVAAFARLGADAVVIEVRPDARPAATTAWVTAVADTGVVNGVWVSFEGLGPEAAGIPDIWSLPPWRTFEVAPS